MLKIVYAFFVGILLAIFVGVGISTFYPEPKAPDAPIYTKAITNPDDPVINEQDAAYQEASKQYYKEINTYNRNVSIIALVAAVVMLVIGLVMASRIDILSESLLLGGVLTLIYSLARGFMNDENTFRFTIVSVGLVAAITVGYFKFVAPIAKQAKTKSKK